MSESRPERQQRSHSVPFDNPVDGWRGRAQGRESASGSGSAETGPAWRPCRDRRWSSRCVALRCSVRWLPP